MEWGVYQKSIDDLAFFSDKLKALIFAGHGEPLTHPDIAKMVAYAKVKSAADRIEIVTNGSLLSKDLSMKLIEAGVDRVKVSIQGTSASKYKKISGVQCDFDALLDNLTWFYEHKTATDVYVKIIDVSLEDEEDEKLFRGLFAPCADHVAVEHAIPFVNAINYDRYGKKMELAKQGHRAREATVCAMPFYMLVLDPYGHVLPCCSTEIPLSFANIKEKSLHEIWNSRIHDSFLALQLKNRFGNPVCAKCSVPKFGLQEGDYLDDHVKELLHLYAD
jgi:radical SAM protein with 4Fe4S-binding SPASM domain